LFVVSPDNGRRSGLKPALRCKGATVTARFGPDGITIVDPNRVGEGAAKVFQQIYEKAICATDSPCSPPRPSRGLG